MFICLQSQVLNLSTEWRDPGLPSQCSHVPVNKTPKREPSRLGFHCIQAEMPFLRTQGTARDRGEQLVQHCPLQTAGPQYTRMDVFQPSQE
jgi:hypothetical protein